VDASLAGLLLVFVGFVYAKADTFQTKRGDRFRHMGKAGTIPFGLALWSGWLCLRFLEGDVPAYVLGLFLFKSTLVATALYGLVVIFIYL
jgi:hypothetical protein